MADAKTTLVLDGEDKGLSKTVDGAAKSVKGLGEEVEGLAQGNPLDKLAADAAFLAEQIARVEAETERLSAAFNEAETNFRRAKLDEGFKEGSEAAQKLRREVERTGKEFSDFAVKSSKALGVPPKHLKRIENATVRVNKEIRKFGRGASSIDKLSSSLKGLRAGAAAGAAAVVLLAFEIGKNLARALVNSSKQALALQVRLQATTTALRETLGGTAAAAEGMAFLEKTSDELRIRIGDLSKNYVDLTAATKGTEVAGGETEKIFRAVVEAGKTLGTTNEALSRSFLGLSQLAGRGSFSLEELRQVTENLPGIMQAFATQLGLTQGELLDLVSSGKLGIDALVDLRKALEDIAGEGVPPAIEDLRGAFDAASVGAEGLSKALGEELTPGVLDMTNALLGGADAGSAFAAAIGAQLSAELTDLAGGLKITDALLGTLFDSFEGLATIRLPDTIAGAAAINTFLDKLNDVPGAAKEAFDALEKSAVLAAQGIEDASADAAEGAAASFAELSDQSKASFKEQAEAAELSAKGRKELEEKLAADLVALDEKTVKARVALLQLLEAASQESGAKRQQIEAEIQAILAQLALDRVAAEAQITEEAVKEIGKRQLAEATATLAIEAEFAKRVEAAQAAAEERLETESAATIKLEELEQASTEKRLELMKEFVEAATLEGEKRVEAEATIQAKLTQLEEDTAAKKKAIFDKTVEDARKAAEERVKAEQEAAEKSIQAVEKIREAIAGLGDAAAQATTGGGEDDGGVFGGINRGLTDARENVEALEEQLEELRVAEHFDKDAVLETGAALRDARLAVEEFAESAEALGENFIPQAEQIAENSRQIQETIAAIREVVGDTEGAFSALGERGTESLLNVLNSYEELSEQSGATDEDVDAFRETIETFAKEAEKSAKQAKEFAKQEEASAKAAAKAAKEVEAAAKAAGELASAERKAASAIEEQGEAATDATDANERMEDATANAASAATDLAQSTEASADGLAAVGSAASALSSQLGQAAAAFGNLSQSVSGLSGAVDTIRQMTDEIANLTSELGAAAANAGELANNLERAAAASS